MSWEKKKLSECCESISDGDHQAPPKADSGIPFITIANINQHNKFDFQNTMFVPREYYDCLDNKRKPQPDDILYSVVGSFGIPVFVRNQEEFVFQRHIAILRPNKKVYPKFLYYVMLSRDFYMQADSVAIGAAQRTISLTALRNMEVHIPPLKTQRRIADILSAYDDLIENNQKQIKLLEEAAQRLYKEWFVDLHFPGWENTTIIDGVPEGWRKSTIESICIKIGAGGTPKRSNKTYWDSKDVKWYKTGELIDGWLIESEEYISEEGLKNSAAKLFPERTILMAIYASPTLGHLGILTDEAACNQAALGLIADENMASWQWLFQKLVELRDDFNAVARGAGQQNISADVVKKKEIILPPYTLIKTYTDHVSSYFDQMLTMNKNIYLLTEARDRLLPKLMSGELEV